MIVDSTILVDLARGYEEAGKFLSGTDEPLCISRVGMMEMVYGARTKQDVKQITTVMSHLGIEIVEISESISKRGGELFDQFWHSRGLGIMDAFIAATALINGAKLATHNTKNFRFIKGLKLMVSY